MKRFSCFIFLLLTANSSFAAWVKVTSLQDEGVTLYYNNSLMSRNGSIAKMWTMHDHKNPKTISGTTFLSSSSLDEYDCSNNTYRFKTTHYYEGNMANGKILHTEHSNIPWQDVNPDSISELNFRIACKKK